jgi:TRAP-type C4-dicarboxylate transport system substrate-binding protein
MGRDNGFDLTMSFRFHEVSKYWSATDHCVRCGGLVHLRAALGRRDPEQKDVFKRAAQIGGKVATDLGEQIDAQGWKI